MLSNVPAQTGGGELVEAVKLKDGDARDPQCWFRQLHSTACDVTKGADA